MIMYYGTRDMNARFRDTLGCELLVQCLSIATELVEVTLRDSRSDMCGSVFFRHNMAGLDIDHR
jgi:hypothetical protein